MAKFHEPVLLKEALFYLDIKSGQRYLDATVGGGGHAVAICHAGGQVLGIDFDPEAIKAARKCLSSACPDTSWQLAQGNFSTLTTIAKKHGFDRVAGVFFDLGASSHQLKTRRRGFSFNTDAFLDMRMDPSLKVTAADLVNGLGKKELTELFLKLGDEHYANRIARAIVFARNTAPIKTCNQLAEIIYKVKSKRGRPEKIHPATRCFQALRIAVNDEFNNLKKALPQALALLARGGRLVVISFHSGEDRIVKHFLKKQGFAGELEILTKKPVRSTQTEMNRNPRSRSACLRAAEKK